MDIKQFAKKPQLIEVVLDTEEIKIEYGDAITFYMMDYVDINTYFEFFRSQAGQTGQELQTLMRQIILTKEGQPALSADEALPIDIAVAALTKINDILGKSRTKPLTNTVGNQPD